MFENFKRKKLNRRRLLIQEKLKDIDNINVENPENKKINHKQNPIIKILLIITIISISIF